jgi:hypothetical protein
MFEVFGRRAMDDRRGICETRHEGGEKTTGLKARELCP